MQVSNPLVPPPAGQPGGAPASVANAPNVPESTQHETSHPVTASTESERGRNETGRGPAEERSERGGSVDISV
jgi:hypothetical protein